MILNHRITRRIRYRYVTVNLKALLQCTHLPIDSSNMPQPTYSALIVYLNDSFDIDMLCTMASFKPMLRILWVLKMPTWKRGPLDPESLPNTSVLCDRNYYARDAETLNLRTQMSYLRSCWIFRAQDQNITSEKTHPLLSRYNLCVEVRFRIALYLIWISIQI